MVGVFFVFWKRESVSGAIIPVDDWHMAQEGTI